MTPARLARISEAAEWAAELDTDDVSQDRLTAFEAWCARDPRHRQIVDRMLGLGGRFGTLDTAGREALRGVLAKPRQTGPRAAAVGLALLVAGALGALLVLPSQRPADSCQTAEAVRELRLADGSRLHLDARSAIEVDLSGRRRHVRLQHGQILAQVAPDPSAPFVVETPRATATALGTAYLVRDDGRETLVAVTESKVRVCLSAAPTTCLNLVAGQRARARDGALSRLHPVDTAAVASWSQGWLEADDRPAAEVVADLNRYRRAPIAFSAADLAGVRVTGAYPLADTDRAAQGLAQATGLRLARDVDRTLRLTR